MLRIARGIRELNTSLGKLDESAAAALEIGRNDMRALEFIARHGHRSPGALARHLRITSGAVTTLLDRMEVNGLLARVADPHDRRRWIIMLTAEGAQQERELFEPLARESAKWLARRPTRHLKVIDEFLEQARSSADAARKRAEKR
jgi:DNA-binding MarR family transcriptional regulator